jgi:hypothetical protein
MTAPQPSPDLADFLREIGIDSPDPAPRPAGDPSTWKGVWFPDGVIPF